jgi:cell division protein FtsI (penicillin-binding protein 3)
MPAPGLRTAMARVSARRGSARASVAAFRLWTAFLVIAFVLSLFAARLIQLQGIDENDYAALADRLGATTIDLEAPRASIYDRNGTPLARSVDASKLTADPTYTRRNAARIATYLHNRLGLDYIETLSLLRKKDTRYVELARHLKPAVAQSIVDRLATRKLAGVYVDKDTTRN